MNALNKFLLVEKVIVVTGAAGLLGVRHVEAILSAGGTPVLIDVDKDRLLISARLLEKKFSTNLTCFNIDITDEKQVEDCCNNVVKIYGHIHGLINNAANNPRIEVGEIGADSRLENFSAETWNSDLSVGLKGAFFCIKYFGSVIAKTGGSIINISSDLGIIAPDQRLYRKHGLAADEQAVKPVTYSVVKTGIIGLTRYVSTYWASNGVRCNTLCPGGVENDQEDLFRERLASLIPLGRMAKKDEYKGSIVFLLSDASSYITGTTLVVDGGRTVW